jgi:hypothetical protein
MPAVIEVTFRLGEEDFIGKYGEADGKRMWATLCRMAGQEKQVRLETYAEEADHILPVVEGYIDVQEEREEAGEIPMALPLPPVPAPIPRPPRRSGRVRRPSRRAQEAVRYMCSDDYINNYTDDRDYWMYVWAMNTTGYIGGC